MRWNSDFEYDAGEHNVVRVTHKDFKSCSASNSTLIRHTGSDDIVIKKPGHLYFICSVPGHCQAGQKVDIRVPPNCDIPSQSPSPSSPSYPPSVAPPPKSTASSPAPAPSTRKSAAPISLHSSKMDLHFLMALLLLAILA